MNVTPHQTVTYSKSTIEKVQNIFKVSNAWRRSSVFGHISNLFLVFHCEHIFFAGSGVIITDIEQVFNHWMGISFASLNCWLTSSEERGGGTPNWYDNEWQNYSNRQNYYDKIIPRGMVLRKDQSQIYYRGGGRFSW